MRKITIFLLFIAGLNGCDSQVSKTAGIATEEDWTLAGFVKQDSINPILVPAASEKFYCPINRQSVSWDEKNVLNPSAVVKEGKVYLVFRSQDSAMVSRLGLAVSEDGLHFKKEQEPVFFPAEDSLKKYEWPGGVEDPRLVEAEDGTYILTYTAFDGKLARLCIATSTDLRHWKKQGLAIKDEKYQNQWTKSGAILTEERGEKIIAVKINGKYWMYFGDTDLFIASSDDLIHWEVLQDAETHKMITVLHPRKGYFDSRLVEPGPFALLRKEGILLIYNSSNAANNNDTALAKFTYSAGQALFDKNQPFKLTERTKHYFISPDKNYEKIGEVNNVCFVEGLVNFHHKWFLYYGTADSKIAVAVKE